MKNNKEYVVRNLTIDVVNMLLAMKEVQLLHVIPSCLLSFPVTSPVSTFESRKNAPKITSIIKFLEEAF